MVTFKPTKGNGNEARPSRRKTAAQLKKEYKGLLSSDAPPDVWFEKFKKAAEKEISLPDISPAPLPRALSYKQRANCYLMALSGFTFAMSLVTAISLVGISLGPVPLGWLTLTSFAWLITFFLFLQPLIELTESPLRRKARQLAVFATVLQCEDKLIRSLEVSARIRRTGYSLCALFLAVAASVCTILAFLGYGHRPSLDEGQGWYDFLLFLLLGSGITILYLGLFAPCCIRENLVPYVRYELEGTKPVQKSSRRKKKAPDTSKDATPGEHPP